MSPNLLPSGLHYFMKIRSRDGRTTKTIQVPLELLYPHAPDLSGLGPVDRAKAALKSWGSEEHFEWKKQQAWIGSPRRWDYELLSVFEIKKSEIFKCGT